MMRRLIYLVGVLVALAFTPVWALDHQYTDYADLLNNHVKWLPDGHASVVNYAGLRQDRLRLKAVLLEFTAVPQVSFDGWSGDQRKAFLINAYNAFTLELILTRYPNIKSIRDLGSLLRSPWKMEFFDLLGKKRHLDWIEHEALRPVFHDARIHFAVNCASVGCPALRPEPYIAEKLDTQLDDQTRRFLSDRSRNRFDGASGTLYVSEIFRWYHQDFSAKGGTVKNWFSAHAKTLASSPAEQSRITASDFKIDYPAYDWLLNDVGHSH